MRKVMRLLLGMLFGCVTAYAAIEVLRVKTAQRGIDTEKYIVILRDNGDGTVTRFHEGGYERHLSMRSAMEVTVMDLQERMAALR